MDCSPEEDPSRGQSYGCFRESSQNWFASPFLLAPVQGSLTMVT